MNSSLEKEKESLGAELDIAKDLQMLLLPDDDTCNQFRDLQVDTYMKPASQVGGDYYDVMKNKAGMPVFGIGDASGHGLDTGVFMMMMRSTVHAVIKTRTDSLEKQLCLINQVAFGDVQRMQADKHMTLSLIEYQGEGRFNVTGQHQEILVIRDTSTVEILDTSGLGLPIGLVEDVEAHVDSLNVRLKPGQTLVMYTNGLVYQENMEGDVYGLDRFISQLKLHANDNLDTIKQAVVNDLTLFSAAKKPYDDVTLMLIRHKRS